MLILIIWERNKFEKSVRQRKIIYIMELHLEEVTKESLIKQWILLRTSYTNKDLD